MCSPLSALSVPVVRFGMDSLTATIQIACGSRIRQSFGRANSRPGVIPALPRSIFDGAVNQLSASAPEEMKLGTTTSLLRLLISKITLSYALNQNSHHRGLWDLLSCPTIAA